jgi:hypothetical protein
MKFYGSPPSGSNVVSGDYRHEPTFLCKINKLYQNVSTKYRLVSELVVISINICKNLA